MASLYIYLDESGNLDFSEGGTNYFLLSAVTTIQPLVSSNALQNLKYALLESGVDVEFFHASPDKQFVRDKVFSVINTLRDININHIYVDKRTVPPNHHRPEIFYSLLGRALVSRIFQHSPNPSLNQIIVIFDKALTHKQERSFLSKVKPALKATGISYNIYFHRTIADFNAQIADYSAWAKYVSLERNELRPLASLGSILIESFDLNEDAAR